MQSPPEHCSGLLLGHLLLSAGQEFTCQKGVPRFGGYGGGRLLGQGPVICALWMPRGWVGVMSGLVFEPMTVSFLIWACPSTSRPSKNAEQEAHSTFPQCLYLPTSLLPENTRVSRLVAGTLPIPVPEMWPRCPAPHLGACDPLGRTIYTQVASASRQ